MDYSSAFIVYIAVFESPSILLFNEKVVSHWLSFYARKSFHLPSLIAVEFTKFSYYCAYVLSTHLSYLSSRACKCMLIFQHGALCWWKDAKCYRHQLSTLVLLWLWNPALSPDSHRNLASSFQLQIFPILSCADYVLMLITFTPGQQAAVSVTLQTLHLHTALVWAAEGWSTLFCLEEVPKLSHTTSQAGIPRALCSCQPQLAPPHAHLERAGPCTGCSTHESPGHVATSAKSPVFPGAFKAPYPPVPVQAHRIPWVFHPSASQVTILRGGCGCWVTSYSNGSAVRPPLSPPWHWQWCVQVTHWLTIISKFSVRK